MITESLSQLRWLAALVLAGTVFFVVLAMGAWSRYYKLRQAALRRGYQVGSEWPTREAVEHRRSFFRDWGDRYDLSNAARPIQDQLIQANLKIKPSEYMALRVLSAIVLFLASWFIVKVSVWLALVLALLLPIYAPRLFLRSRRHHYVQAFNAQLAETAATLSSAVKAGLSIPQAFEQVGRKLPPPAGLEFRQLAREVNLLGVRLDIALHNMLARVPSDDLGVMITIIQVQHQAGGNLVAALSELSDTMRERLRLFNEIRTMTAEVRYSAYMIIALPIVILLFMRNAMPQLIEQIFIHPLGWAALAIFAGMQAVGYVLVRHIADIKV